MNGIAPPEMARRVKALGFPQGHFPQMVYHHNLFGVRTLTYETECLCHCDWHAAPLLLSGDPEHPGIVEWLESQERPWQWWHFPDVRYRAERPTSDLCGWERPITTDTLSGLIDKILASMEAQNAVQAD